MRLRFSLTFYAFVLLLAAVPVRPALAATCDAGGSPLDVTATPLSFGNYDAASSTANTATMTVTVECSVATDILPAFTVALSKGGAPDFNPRQMSLAANRLNYNIFTSSAYTSVWGDGTGGTLIESSGGGVNSINLTGYGGIAAGQFVTPGTYIDTITVTVTY